MSNENTLKPAVPMGAAPNGPKPAIRKLGRMRLFDYANYAVIIILCACFLYPLILTFSISVSKPTYGEIIYFLPKGFKLDSYLFLLNDSRLMRYYSNSVLYAVSSTVLFLFLTSMMAYPFIIPDFKGKKFLNIFMVVTMFFGGGLIPYYFVIRSLKMLDTVWVMIIPGVVGAYNVIIFRTFFTSIPTELRESAYIDGAGHFTTLFRIIAPVSKPLLATFALFNLVGKWNDFFSALMFLRSDALMPMQMLLRKMLVLYDFREGENRDLQLIYTAVSSRSMKCAAVVITILPILCVYPFLQKYFAKGVMVGSLKS